MAWLQQDGVDIIECDFCKEWIEEGHRTYQITGDIVDKYSEDMCADCYDKLREAKDGGE